MNLKYLLLIAALLVISASILLKEVLYSQEVESRDCTSLIDKLSIKAAANLRVDIAPLKSKECLVKVLKNYHLKSSCLDSGENQKTTIAMTQ